MVLGLCRVARVWNWTWLPLIIRLDWGIHQEPRLSTHMCLSWPGCSERQFYDNPYIAQWCNKAQPGYEMSWHLGSQEPVAEMALVKTSGPRIAAICTCVPSRRFNNLTVHLGGFIEMQASFSRSEIWILKMDQHVLPNEQEPYAGLV